MKIKINQKAPNFKLPSTNGTKFELNNLKRKNIVLYFYPKDDTPGCTLESQDFSKLNNMILKNKTVIYGISADSIQSHLNFKKKYKIKFQLLSDINKKVIKKYGVWGKKIFMGKNYMGIIRTTFLIDSNRKVLKIWNNVRVKDHAKDVYSEIKKIV
tara:strand:+ start:104 stop:571 length:468 start_codon:yes stop_codon:yes gene_type:complete